MLQVLLFDTLNCFFVSDDGSLVQKAYAPGQAGADQNGWVTHNLTAANVCKPDEDLEYQDGFHGDFHLFAKHANGTAVVHLTYVHAQHVWVTRQL